VTPDPSDCLLTISEFGRRTRLSTKALRIYDETGLLRPTQVDRHNGYRRYSIDQITVGRLIAMLRSADIALLEIGQLLDELVADRPAAVDRLERNLAELESQHASRRVLLRHVHAILREDDLTMFPIHSRHVPARRVLSIQRRVHGDQTDAFVAEARAAFAQHLGATSATGPFTLIFHGVVDNDNDGPLEAIIGCPAEVQPSDVVGVRTEPAHDEAYTTITKAQWDYPAILAAYDAVACSAEALARPGSQLSCREVYVAEPDRIGPDDPVCDIAFPLA
jgi:DNA-binding transcriptional MerR regulator